LPNSVTESAFVHSPTHPPVKVLSSWFSSKASLRYARIFGPCATTRIVCHSPRFGSVTLADVSIRRFPLISAAEPLPGCELPLGLVIGTRRADERKICDVGGFESCPPAVLASTIILLHRRLGR